jgi:uncharacterized membrane protein YccF (DUF307 family)
MIFKGHSMVTKVKSLIFGLQFSAFWLSAFWFSAFWFFGLLIFRPFDFRPYDFRPFDVSAFWFFGFLIFGLLIFGLLIFRPFNFSAFWFSAFSFRPFDFRPIDFRPYAVLPVDRMLCVAVGLIENRLAFLVRRQRIHWQSHVKLTPLCSVTLLTITCFPSTTVDAHTHTGHRRRESTATRCDTPLQEYGDETNDL